MLQPVADWFETRRVPRPGAALLSLVVGGSATILVLGSVVSLVASELLQLSRRLPEYLTRGEQLMQHHREWDTTLVRHLHLSPSLVNTSLTTLYHLSEGLVRSLLLLVLKIPSLGLVVVIGTVSAYFLIRDHQRISAHMLGALPPSIRPQYQAAKYDIVNGTLGFLKAEALLVFMTAAITTAGLLVMGIRYGVLVGIAAGLLDLIPYLGPTAILGPWILLAWVVGHHILAVKLLIVLLAVALVRQLLEPRLVGANMGLHPLVALMALYIGVRLFGASGIIIGPVTALILKVVYRAHQTIG